MTPLGCKASTQVTFIAVELALFAVTFLGGDGSAKESRQYPFINVSQLMPAQMLQVLLANNIKHYDHESDHRTYERY